MTSSVLEVRRHDAGADAALRRDVSRGPPPEPVAGGPWRRAVGRLYAANTWGSLAGAVAAGFILIPLLGIRRTLFLCATINVVLALVVHRALPGEGTAPSRARRAGAPWYGLRPGRRL